MTWSHLTGPRRCTDNVMCSTHACTTNRRTGITLSRVTCTGNPERCHTVRSLQDAQRQARLDTDGSWSEQTTRHSVKVGVIVVVGAAAGRVDELLRGHHW